MTVTCEFLIDAVELRPLEVQDKHRIGQVVLICRIGDQRFEMTSPALDRVFTDYARGVGFVNGRFESLAISEALKLFARDRLGLGAVDQADHQVDQDADRAEAIETGDPIFDNQGMFTGQYTPARRYEDIAGSQDPDGDQ